VAEQFADDAVAVLDETGTDRAAVVGFSRGAAYLLQLAERAPERLAGQVFISPTTQLSPFAADRAQFAVRFEDTLDTEHGWAMENARFWQHNFPRFLEFFFGQVFPEPHSTKQIEDAVGWGGETSAQTLTDSRRGASTDPKLDVATLPVLVRCPSLVIQGTRDAIVGPDAGGLLARALGPQARLVCLGGSGHAPHARDPVKVNLLIREFVDSLPWPTEPRRSDRPNRPELAEPADLAAAPPVRHWTRASRRRRRLLFVSSPIGLGHARRDLAIADELRVVHPDLQIDWLAQHPVTTVLRGRGERVHPASAALASESGHIEGEAGEHDLHVFQAWRRMDEILCANFMVFDDLVREDDAYDAWVGDEAWELDYYLHENPELKRAAYVWMTDFVGWLPMPDGGPAEERLTADYNAQMIEHIDRFPRIRDRAIFVGAPGDIVPDSFGAGLPAIRDWTVAHYDFTGDYITGLTPLGEADRAAQRAELGYAPDETVCIVTVGGSGVGAHLLAKVVGAYELALERLPGLRMIAVTGPRIDPSSLVAPRGVHVHGYVPDLHRYLAVCDVAVVQGGLTTTMELTAAGRPFIYFPLAHHFEQNFHVTHRLGAHQAGRRMDYASATPESIAAALVEEARRAAAYRPVGVDGARRAAARIAELL
jgi:pimeloyl-ACP methyl ester carboxylesterase/predicted glycosyltransferase